MEIVKVNNGEIEVAQEILSELKRMNDIKAELEMKEKEVKQAVLEAMEENGVKSFNSEIVRIIYIAPTTRTSVDTKALKEQGLYDAFAKESPVKASVRMEYK